MYLANASKEAEKQKEKKETVLTSISSKSGLLVVGNTFRKQLYHFCLLYEIWTFFYVSLI